MKKFVTGILLLGLFLAMSNPVAAQFDEENCGDFPNLDSVVDCKVQILFPEDFPQGDTEDPEILLAFRIEYETESIAEESFDEYKEGAAESEGTEEIEFRPTKAYELLGIRDAVQGEQDGTTVVILRDEKVMIIIATNLNEDQVSKLVEIVVEEDELPEEFEGLSPLSS